MRVKKKHKTGAMANFPKRILQAMVNEQIRQGNQANPYIFTNNPYANINQGGFNWEESLLGAPNWKEIIYKNNFSSIPKQESVHEKIMKQYAKDAAVLEKPWEFWEFKANNCKTWHSLVAHPLWDDETEYRRKIETQAESKKQPTPNEIIQAMLAEGMDVWACVSDRSYDGARSHIGTNIQKVVSFSEGVEYPVQAYSAWKFAVPVDITTMTEITKIPE